MLDGSFSGTAQVNGHRPAPLTSNAGWESRPVTTIKVLQLELL